MTLPAEIKQEIASVRRDINYLVYGGTLENPDETLLKRGGGKGLKLYDEIEEDSHAYAVLQKRKLAVIARPWEVKSASDKRLDKKAADLVRAQLETKLDQLTLDLLDATLKGFSVSELMWGDSGSEIFVSEFKARDQMRFTFTPENLLRLLTRQNMVSGEAVPEKKFIRHSFGAKSGSPFGKGLGSKLYFPVWFKRQGISFWLVFCEKFGMPTAVGKYGVNATSAEQSKLLEALRALAQDAGVIIPEGMEITLLEATRSSTADLYERLIRYMDEQISEAVLGETLTTNIGSVGSKAAADTHNGVRLEVSKADSDLLSQTLNNTLCKWIVELNLPGANPPTIWRTFEEQEDLNTRSTRDKTLFDMGFKLKSDAVKEIYGDHYEVVDQGAGDSQTSNQDFLKNSGVDAAVQTDNVPQDANAGFAELEKIFELSAETVKFADWLDEQLNETDLNQVLSYLENLDYLPEILYKTISNEFMINNNLEIATYALIGKRVVELFKLGVGFAENGRSAIKKPEQLLELKTIIETVYQDGISAIPDAYLDGDNFVGVFEDAVGENLTKRFNFTLSESGIEYKLINPGDVSNFAEVEFATTPGKKKKNCTKGVSCGNSCIGANKTCRKGAGEIPGDKVTALKQSVGGDVSPENKAALVSSVKRRIAELEANPNQDKVLLMKMKKRLAELEVPLPNDSTKPPKAETKKPVVTKPKDVKQNIQKVEVEISADKKQSISYNTASINVSGSVTVSGRDDTGKVEVKGIPSLEGNPKQPENLIKQIEHHTSPMQGSKSELGSAYELRNGKLIKSQKEFQQEIEKAIEVLNAEKRLDGIVPIYLLRRSLGDRISRKDFDEYMIEMQSKDKFNLLAGELKDKGFAQTEDSMQVLGNYRNYVQLTTPDLGKLPKAESKVEKPKPEDKIEKPKAEAEISSQPDTDYRLLGAGRVR